QDHHHGRAVAFSFHPPSRRRAEPRSSGIPVLAQPGADEGIHRDGRHGRFLGLFSVLVNAAFSYAGAEIAAVASGESMNPRKNIPKAARRIFWRILFFYSLGSLAIGVLLR